MISQDCPKFKAQNTGGNGRKTGTKNGHEGQSEAKVVAGRDGAKQDGMASALDRRASRMQWGRWLWRSVEANTPHSSASIFSLRLLSSIFPSPRCACFRSVAPLPRRPSLRCLCPVPPLTLPYPSAVLSLSYRSLTRRQPLPNPYTALRFHSSSVYALVLPRRECARQRRDEPEKRGCAPKAEQGTHTARRGLRRQRMCLVETAVSSKAPSPSSGHRRGAAPRHQPTRQPRRMTPPYTLAKNKG
ncbi:unnamed protein product [Bursaphelenchus okinawaensis]|uniref:Uncharacterized protein n=1 Tax=Bursaphelenchus okinawaensis TaxID=465554 RepID=A0A811KPR5_9BILA|nr:unnamed protein product [Bursaphelenchus okinawaensis]CAG9108179.1 unnamed protein product [Bursaphelenchus okinawaensis]